MTTLRLTALFAAPALILAAACGFGNWSWDEVDRVQAPDGSADAVLIETNGGATTSFGYHVYIVAPGRAVPRSAAPESEAAQLYGAARPDGTYGANLRWLGSDTLAVEYLRARWDSLTNPTVDVSSRRVVVILRPGVEDPGAPGGGMEYNQGKARTPR